MNTHDISVEIPDILRYNHTVRRNVKSFSGHSHNLYEILFINSGDVSHIIEDREYRLKKGDLVITRPSKYHFIKINSDTDYDRHNILFDSKELNIDTSVLPERLDVINVAESGIINGIFEKLDYYCLNLCRENFINMARLLIQEMIYNVAFVEKHTENESRVINPILSKAVAYIAENLFTVKDVAEIAQALFVTESYLYRLFRRELMKSPKKYITEKRLLHAQNRIKRGERPSGIARECGFEDYTTFYRNYVAMFRHAPSCEKSV